MKTKDAKCCTGVAVLYDHPTRKAAGCRYCNTATATDLQPQQLILHLSFWHAPVGVREEFFTPQNCHCHGAERENRLTWTAASEFSYVKIHSFSWVLCCFYLELFGSTESRDSNSIAVNLLSCSEINSLNPTTLEEITQILLLSMKLEHLSIVNKNATSLWRNKK